MRPWRIRRLTEDGRVIGWVIEQHVHYAGMPEPEYVVVDYFPSGVAAIATFANRGVLAA
ncbi:hypothetical protein FGG30_gp060 [Mycobacterium phage Pixie]|uniref:Uncharacterized protein n=2 Tax=Keshuvirus pixie TaxID=1034114 RepID=G1D4W9_9CAUD|nr:hypothetical protein FGG30_gp060 [Mycobacterium phage Pixie]AEK09872.1 hypothetical protein PBI_PIXIE_60 [Mycobacterium phage Pixie]AOT23798.1 hypothetical protein SEA_TBOND007_59 [Mycobacterium phage TBond007]